MTHVRVGKKLVLRVATVKTTPRICIDSGGRMCQKKPLRWIYVTASHFYGSPRVEFHNTPEFTTHENLPQIWSVKHDSRDPFSPDGEIRKKKKRGI